MRKRVISWLLTVVMVVSMLPTSVLADTLAADQEQQTQQEQIAPVDTEHTVPAEDEETQEHQEPAEEVPVSRSARSGGVALALAAAGTVQNIGTAEKFDEMQPDGTYRLTADITVTKPYANEFTGTFDGNGKTITGLTFNQQETNNVGLIGRLGENGIVRDVKLDKVNIKANKNVGGIVGGNNGGSIIGCSVSGDISGVLQVGGVVGYLGIGNNVVTACYHEGSVSGSVSVGGVAGDSDYGSLTACYHVGNVSGSQKVGGVTGFAPGNLAKVKACYWNGYDGNGIGLGRGEATKVDGTTVTWQTAVDAMNAALQNAGSEWRYELTGELPTLKK